MSGLTASHDIFVEGSWNDLRWLNKSSLSQTSVETMKSKAEDIMQIFQKAAVFNPPQGMRIVPLGEFHKSITLVESNKSPERISLQPGIRIPPDANRSATTVNVWINDPLFLPGDPVLNDHSGEIFMLPSLTGNMAGQSIYSRRAKSSGIWIRTATMEYSGNS
jgi:hypothetical protein